MFRILLAVFALLSCSASWAQHTLSGKVKDQLTGQPVPFAMLSLNSANSKIALTLTPDAGFVQQGVAAGTYRLVIVAPGFKPYDEEIVLKSDRFIEVVLVPMTVVSDELTVSAIKARKDAPTAYTELSRKDIAKENYGQDIPYLLNMTPSVVVNSDAGAGVGYTDIRIRGVDNTRINVTVNGIPINDAESQGTFLVNMPDLATSVQQIQVQRGIGTSTNGPAAFGASINMQTLGVQTKPYGEVTNAYGSFNTVKNNIQFGTGLLPSRWAIDGRLSSIVSDGYIDRATSDLKSYYFSVGHYGERSLLKFVHFSGKEKTYQAWNGVPEDKLKTDRTFNEFTYPNQTDNYKQSHYQLFYNISPTDKLSINTALHFTHGEGYYEEYKEDDAFSNYNLPNVIIGGDTITNTNLVRQRWLNNDFGGFVASLNYKFSTRTDLTLGGGGNRYFGNHYGIITWAQYASTSTNLSRYYDNDAQKTDWNIYAKLNHKFNARLRGLLDMQVRGIDYSFLGFNQDLENVQQEVSYLFFNPKAGLVYDINTTDNIYLSYSRASREPTRSDFTETSLQSRPKQETMDDYEAGYRITRKRWGIQANLFWMQYKDQLILTGQINDVGSYTHTNTPESFRRGVELSATFTLTAKLQVMGNIMVSQNKIKSFTEYVDDYDGGPQQTFNYSNTDLAASPNTVAGAQLHYIFLPNLTGDVYYKHVSRQYLDNTQSDARSIDAYHLVDLGFNYNLPLKGWLSYMNAGVKLNNIANAMYVSKGYTYSGFSGGVRGDYNYYYPQAGFNFLAQVSLGF